MTINIEDIKPGEMVVCRDFGPMKVVAILDGVALLEGTGNHRMIARLSECIAKQKVELPTEPGIYRPDSNFRDHHVRIFRLDAAGWEELTGSLQDGETAEGVIRDFGWKMVRLLREFPNRAQTAAEVIDWIATKTQYVPQVTDTMVEDWRKHFGVES